MGILEIEQFADFAKVQQLLDIYEGSVNRTEAERCLQCNKPYSNFIYYDGDVIQELAAKVSELVPKSQLSYSGISVMTNSDMQYHADNCKPSNDKSLGTPTEGPSLGLIDVSGVKWVPNHCHTRTTTVVIYLKDLDTGATVFPLQHKIILPASGKAVIFPCDSNHIHGVEDVGKNIRLAAIMWFTELV